MGKSRSREGLWKLCWMCRGKRKVTWAKVGAIVVNLLMDDRWRAGEE
jgi:hypothetical protein